jgi:hypothetical protein
MKRVLVISDPHCGHLVGLTPPGWWVAEKDVDASRTKRNKYAATQRQCWQFYEEGLKKFGPFDVAILNGDAIDGKGDRSGGTEQITTDREEQAEMAVAAVRPALGKNTKLVMTFGTAYHTGRDEDWESIVASDLGAVKIGSHEWVDVDGVMFDCKHHVGSSSIPHGRHTSVARENLWSVLWAERGQIPRSKTATVIVRSHVHYFSYCGGTDWMALTTPALQGLGTKYGGRVCSGIVDFGFLVFECHKGEFTLKKHLAEVKSQCAQALKL